MKHLLGFAVVALMFCPGCKEEGKGVAGKAGTKVGETLTGFAAGVGKGMDKQMAVDAELTPALLEQGISKTVAKSTALDVPSSRPASRPASHRGITVYLLASKPFKSVLIARAMNKDAQEVGRSTVSVEFGAGDAKYVTFGFPDEMDTQLVEKYLIDISK